MIHFDKFLNKMRLLHQFKFSDIYGIQPGGWKESAEDCIVNDENFRAC